MAEDELGLLNDADRARLNEQKNAAFAFGENLQRALNALPLSTVFALENRYGKPQEKWSSTQKMAGVIYGHEQANGKKWTDVESMSQDDIQAWVSDWAEAHPKAGMNGNAKALRTSKQHGPPR